MPRASEKQLESTRASSEHQKAWFASLRHRVFDEKKPYAIAQADMPLEIFQLLDVPVVSNQWWAAVVSAKQLSGYYFDALNAKGYHEGLCRYCSLSLASSISGDPEKAPWAGSPSRPFSRLVSRVTAYNAFLKRGPTHSALNSSLSIAPRQRTFLRAGGS